MLSEELGRFFPFDHVTFLVGNAKQAVSYHCIRMGFEPLAYRGLETGETSVVSHAIRQNKITFVLKSHMNTASEAVESHPMILGDRVRDIAFTVDDCQAVYKKAVASGATGIKEPWEESDEYGTVVFATVQVDGGDVTHTFVDRSKYKGLFLPGYHKHPYEDPVLPLLPPVQLDAIDHAVGNDVEELSLMAEIYEKTLLMCDVVCPSCESGMQGGCPIIKTRNPVMPLIRGQLDCKGGCPIIKKRNPVMPLILGESDFKNYTEPADVQHVAMNTPDIISTVKKLRARGMEFLNVPDTYYDQLRERLKTSDVTVKENISELQQLRILVDCDEKGYLLHIFTMPTQNRTSLYFEIVERHNYKGFGTGSFKALMDAIAADNATPESVEVQ